MIDTQKYIGSDIATILAQKGLDGNSGPAPKGVWLDKLKAVGKNDVERVLNEPAGVYRLERLLTLVSPAAQDYLEQMAQIAHQLTVQRFGKTIRLFAPLYLSNYCVNSCMYCGFSKKHDFKRTRLTIDQAVRDADIIAGEGFTDILLVSSEDRKFIGVDYLEELAGRLRDKFSSISMEIYRLSSEKYGRLFRAGIEGVTIFQETYDRKLYEYYHPAGPKADYDSRLREPDDFAGAGMRQTGLGVLLGLNDWRVEALALAEHAHYLMKRYWRSQVSFSFPRMRPACEVEASQFKHLLSDKNLVQMITALRLCFADAGLVISTRERAKLRDNLIKLGITKMSAGSKTNPGGYSGQTDVGEQFEVNDTRSAAEISVMLKSNGLEPVWKDWDKAYIH
ncbi:MAG: 2-iminoacetate synthase ThiH [Planctomycetota bacterium]|nr:2-iminoacetate synthase ThiH [Planctomycetota bacterium]